MVRRSPDFWLGILGVTLVFCLGAVAYGHIRYTAAENVYENHLQHVVIRPHVDVKAELAGYAENTDRWLRVRMVASALTAAVVSAVLIQVVRRRNARVAVVESREDEA